MIQVDHSWEHVFRFNNIFRNNSSDLAIAVGITTYLATVLGIALGISLSFYE
jgi:hypothetical protein